MNEKYFIRWRNKATGAMGQGEKPLLFETAKTLVDMLNEKFPDTHHWATEKVGKKPLNAKEPTLKRSVTAPLSDWLLAKQISGNGQASAGWREALKYWRENHPNEDLPFTDALEDEDTFIPVPSFDDEAIPFNGELLPDVEGIDHKLNY